MRLTLVSPGLMDHVVPTGHAIQYGYDAGRIPPDNGEIPSAITCHNGSITDAVPCGMSAEPLVPIQEEGLGRDDQVHALAALGPTSSKI